MLFSILLPFFACEEPIEDIIPIKKSDEDQDGFAAEEGDCNDNNPEIFPGMVETCDGIDNNCNGEVDENAQDARTWYEDSDGDGWGNQDITVTTCAYEVGGYVLPPNLDPSPSDFDCDDTNSSVFPGNLDLEDFGCYLDSDEDGWGDLFAEAPLDSGSDCDDSDANTSPSQGFNEIFAGCFRDSDSDGYADKFVDDGIDIGTDCNDENDSIFPGSVYFEENLCLVDSDGDGYGDANITDERYDIGRDCDDSDSLSYPNAYEVCDGKDNDCNERASVVGLLLCVIATKGSKTG